MQRMQRNVIESHVMAQDRMQGNVESLVLAHQRIQRNPNPKNALQRIFGTQAPLGGWDPVG